MKVIFIDVSPDAQFIECLRSYFGERENIQYQYGDVKDIDVQGKAFISPANSLLFMDGGIDNVFSRVMFPGIEDKAKQKMRTLNKQTLIGRPYLPVGSAIIVPTQHPTTYLISSPTMFLPHDVSMTRNAYHSFMAALCVFDKFKKATNNKTVDTLVCCSLCCGWGKMSYQESAKQIWEAYHDFMSVKRPAELGDKSDPYSYVTASRDEEQPNCYDNREIKNILI